MRLENTARGWRSVMTSESGSVMSGLSQMIYGFYIVESPARAYYIPHHEEREDGAHYRLLLRLRPRDRAPFPRAGLERGCHHANAARRRAAPVGTAPRA